MDTLNPFRSDPVVQKLREGLLRRTAELQADLRGVRPPDPARAEAARARIEAWSELRGGPLALPYLATGRGRGPLVELVDGSVKYDMIGGIGVHFLGHGHPALLEAALDAALEDVAMQGNLQQGGVVPALGEDLLRLANEGGAALRHVFFTTSGAMANENALKLAFHRHAPADRLLAFEGGFAGRTLALAWVTDRPGYRTGLPPTLAVDYVPFFDPGDPAGSTARAHEALCRHLDRYPGRHAAMIFELVQGERGFYPGSPAFFRPLMAELRDRGVAVVVDEIQTFGRTHAPFAFQHFGLDELVDLVTVGKMTQVCATLFRPEYRPPAGLVSQTFTGATASFWVGRAVVREIREAGLFGPEGRNARVEAFFRERLGRLAERMPERIRGPFGLGAMVAFTPFDGSEAAAKATVRRLFDEGIVAFTAGHDPARVRFLVPTPAVSEADLEAVVGIVERVIEGGPP